MLGVVGIASHGSNMGFVGESGVCPFSENWRRHGTANVVGRTRFPDLGQTGFTPTTKQQTNKTVPRGRFFRRRPSLVLEFSEAIDVEATLYTCI